ncbi:hypothetical protein O181_070008 [Austropuccinia psidii MF-1]|uniref:Uncharacterized protein n=1 Tax=Austropuccinia psidii MF-1 TaxID=1389203 RepID=A0A9Q3F363_9BASI|nr:hypothetical protein [Austropuccinia psidii MF-1]
MESPYSIHQEASKDVVLNPSSIIQSTKTKSVNDLKSFHQAPNVEIKKNDGDDDDDCAHDESFEDFRNPSDFNQSDSDQQSFIGSTKSDRPPNFVPLNSTPLNKAKNFARISVDEHQLLTPNSEILNQNFYLETSSEIDPEIDKLPIITSILSYSLWDHLKYEINSINNQSAPQDFTYSLRSERISNFFNVPISIERMILFGFIICLDSFLSIFTILPIKFLFSLIKFSSTSTKKIINSNKFFKQIFNKKGNLNDERLNLTCKIHLIQGFLIILVCITLHHITDASRMYHSVRGQETIKLYVIFNVLEIADRLCCSFGQDILDSLFSSSTLSRRTDGSQPHMKPIFLFILAFIFTVAHTLVLFYQLVSLNVAINSYDNALMTLLISNQFVEIKGSVFKKFEKENLFQMSCADIVERFQLFLMLNMIAFRNLIELSGSTSILSSTPAYTFQYLPASFNIFPSLSLIQTIFLPALVVMFSEVIVDWLKHAFITKFNHIRPGVYGRFIDVLCKDLVGEYQYDETLAKNEKLQPFVDKSPAVSRRLGFSVYPICCLTVRVFFQALGMLSDASQCEECSNLMAEMSSIFPDSIVVPSAAPTFSFQSLKNLLKNLYSNPSLTAPSLDSFESFDSHSSSFSSLQLYSLFILCFTIGMAFLTLFKLYLGIYLRAYAIERVRTLDQRLEEDDVNGKGRSPIACTQSELLKEKMERNLIEVDEFDVPSIRKRDFDLQQSVLLTSLANLNGENSTSTKLRPESVSKGESKKKITMDELSRFDMVRSRIW